MEMPGILGCGVQPYNVQRWKHSVSTTEEYSGAHRWQPFRLKPFLFKSSLLARVDRIVIGARFFCIQVLRNGV